jgi:galactokinase
MAQGEPLPESLTNVPSLFPPNFMQGEALPTRCHSVSQAFQNRFNTPEAPRLFYAPGRVNLIGEHTDYNNGFVLPIAIEFGTLVAGRLRDVHRLRVFSRNQDECREISLESDPPLVPGDWLNYVIGEARTLIKSGFPIQGADLLIDSNVPVGAGLSSSAALENSVGFALLRLSGVAAPNLQQLALAGQKAEHQYVGTQCGIMDQFITAMGRSDHALLIDCRSLHTTAVPIHLPDWHIVICDSGVKHALASSAYNQRRQECQAGVEQLRQHLPDIQSLRDVNMAQWELFGDKIEDPILKQRIRHVISENVRTLKAAEALRAGDTEMLGRLMAASHRSLQEDYDVSCPELDTLVAISQNLPGVAGARMTGGGFGGCTVNLVHDHHLQQFATEISQQYHDRFDRTPAIYGTRACGGVTELTAAQCA